MSLALLCAATFVVLALAAVFFWAFTGPCSPTKNRVAIAFSYAFVAAALVTPFVMVDTVVKDSSLLEYLGRAPVGITIAQVHGQPEWVLNIGRQSVPQSTKNEEAGGVVVPLYVIFFAIVGAAINMTRQVPRYQPESERESRILTSLELPFPERRKPRGRNRRREHWRVGLLSNYMYLVSAPFLAVCAYQLMIWTGVDTRTPIVVLASFSVGIVSDPVLKKLTDIGYSFLRHRGQPSEPISIAPADHEAERKAPVAAAAGHM